MATKKKLLQAAAGSAGVAGPPSVEDVFSTYLYDGNGSTETITNGIDLSGEGGLVWIKHRVQTTDHALYDTERGTLERISSNLSDQETTDTGGLTAFNSDGFTVGGSNSVNYYEGTGLVSWTFRKAPKFFDIVTWTGDGTSSRNISHNLGSAPGFIAVKNLSEFRPWITYHRSSGATKFMELNNIGAEGTSSTVWANTTPTDSVFTVGSNDSVNQSGRNYVAYLFAHNDGDGVFGPNEDQDIIKCGSFSHTSGGSPTFVDCGFEAGWVIAKRTDGDDSWWMADDMRGLTVNGIPSDYASANGTGVGASDWIGPDAQGFDFNYQSGDWIYVAIRRGPMKVPEDATTVFKPVSSVSGTDATFETGFPVDLSVYTQLTTGSSRFVATRMLQEKRLRTDTDAVEDSQTEHRFDFMDGSLDYGYLANYGGWHWRRAPKFFDTVVYTGNGTAGRSIAHNLEATPEMIWVKMRNSNPSWAVYHKSLDVLGPQNKFVVLDANGPVQDSTIYWNDTAPTSTAFTVGSGFRVNASNYFYVAYLFTSLDGISKLGGYQGNGTSQTIDCGFTSGARFVLLKRINSTGGDWVVFDTNRGITSGSDDPFLTLNTTAGNSTSSDKDLIPNSSGFTISGSSSDINASGDTYIFYAIA